MILLDSPLNPYSTPEEVRAWLRELAELRVGARGASDLAAIARAEVAARAYLVAK